MYQHSIVGIKPTCTIISVKIKTKTQTKITKVHAKWDNSHCSVPLKYGITILKIKNAIKTNCNNISHTRNTHTWVVKPQSSHHSIVGNNPTCTIFSVPNNTETQTRITKVHAKWDNSHYSVPLKYGKTILKIKNAIKTNCINISHNRIIHTWIV